MGELGDLLALLHGAGGRWTSCRLTGRRWGRADIAGDAMRRFAEARSASGASAGTAFSIRGGDAPTEWEMTTRSWIDRLGERHRSESTGTHGESLSLRVGRRWWSYTPSSGAISNEDAPEVGGGGNEHFDWMLDPAFLLAGLDFTVSGSALVADRPAIAAVAIPRPFDTRRGFGPPVAHGADEVLLAVDRERGVVLRAESRLDGRPFSLHEITEVAFDERFPDELFRFASPDGSPVRSTRDAFSRPEPMALEEAARRAAFTVLAPARLPKGWTLDASYSPASVRPPRPESVIVTARSEDRREARVRIHQTAQPLSDGLQWEDVQHGGRSIHLFRPGGPGSAYEAKVEIDGTHARVSANIERAALLDIIASLGPAPKNLPPLR